MVRKDGADNDNKIYASIQFSAGSVSIEKCTGIYLIGLSLIVLFLLKKL